MQRIINFRPFLLTALFIISAVICGVIFATVNYVVGIVIASVLFVLASVLAVIYRKIPVRLITFILCALLTAWSFASSSMYLLERNTVITYEESVAISGRVCEVVSHDTTNSLVIEDLIIDGDNVSGKMCIRLNENDTATKYVRIGDSVSLYSTPIVSKVDFHDLSYNEIKYYAYTSLDYVSIKVGSMTFREQILQSLRATYNNWLGEYGELAYGIITGDKNGLNNDIRSAYSTSGLAHILAVSGLHVGFLMSLVSFLLRKLRVNKKVQPWICLAILLAYNVLVGFSYSIIRASIMFMIAYIARINGKWSDGLNNLCLAVSVIVSVFPFSIFDVGFIMSVGCVLSIVLFSQGLTDFFLRLSKGKYEKFLSTIAVCICAQVGVFPAMTFYFSSVSLYSPLANVVAMPLLNAIYVFLLIFGILASLIPFLGYVLALARYLFIAVDWINKVISFLPFSEIVVYGSVGIFSLYLLYFISSKYVMLRKKLIAIICCMVLIVGVVVMDNVRFVGDTHLVYSNARYDVTTIIKTGDKYTLVGDITKYCKIDSNVKNARIHHIDGMYVTYLTENNVDRVINLVDKYDINVVYVREETSAYLVQELYKNDVNVKLAETQSLFKIEEKNGNFVGYSYKGVLLTSYKTDIYGAGEKYLSSFSVVRAYSCKAMQNVNFALNFAYKEEEKVVGANEDTVLLDCKTHAHKRF